MFGPISFLFDTCFDLGCGINFQTILDRYGVGVQNLGPLCSESGICLLPFQYHTETIYDCFFFLFVSAFVLCFLSLRTFQP